MQPIFHKPNKPVEMLKHDLAAVGMGIASLGGYIRRRCMTTVK